MEPKRKSGDDAEPPTPRARVPASDGRIAIGRDDARALPSGERPSVTAAHPLFEQLAEPVASLDLTFAVLFANPAFAALFGVSRGALLGTRTWLVELDGRAPGLTAALEDVAASGQSATVAADGGLVFTAYRAAGALWLVGRARLPSESRLPAAPVSARTMPGLSEAMVSIVAHDLRAPLSAVTLAATMLELGDADARTLGAAARILTSARRMRRMVEQMLDLAALRAHGGVRLDKRATSLVALAQTIVTETEAAHQGAEIRFESHGDARGVWDEDRLTQALANVLGNALQHGGPGPVLVRVDGHAADTVTVEVTNQGTIPAHHLPTLFEPFTRAGRRVGRDGVGLGLYIARAIAHGHGGSLEVRSVSTPLDGPTTTFILTLPRVAGDAAPLTFDALRE